MKGVVVNRVYKLLANIVVLVIDDVKTDLDNGETFLCSHDIKTADTATTTIGKSGGDSPAAATSSQT